MFFVVSGTARVMIPSAGREVLFRQIEAGEFFGELAAIDAQPRSSGILAATDVTLARMPATAFRAAVHAHPNVCDRLLIVLARRDPDAGESRERVQHTRCPLPHSC